MLEPRCDGANAYNQDMRPASITSMRAERSPGGKAATAAANGTTKKKADLKRVMPEVWKLVRPRRWLLVGGLALMAINRVAGLVLPLSTKYFFDPTTLEGRAAAYRRHAQASAAAYWAALGELLRRQPQRHAGFAHHERR